MAEPTANPNALPAGFNFNQQLSQQYGFPVATNPEGKKVKWGGYAVPPGSIPRPDYGNGAYQTMDGGVFIRNEKGIPVSKGKATSSPGVRGDAASRLYLGFDTAVEANANIDKQEARAQNVRVSGPLGLLSRKGKPNPYDEEWGASLLDSMDDSNGAEGWQSALARKVGGDRYQAYNQAAKSFEAAVLPIFSGAAVTASEAARQVKASLPAWGDGAATLKKKARNRQMMINGAAALMGRQPVYPGVPSWLPGSGGTSAPSGAPDQPQAAAPAPAPAAAAAQRPALDEIFR